MRTLALACLFALASADPPALPTLEEMVSAIMFGGLENNFHADDFTVSKKASVQAAGCLLDKVVAVASPEDGIKNFPNDLLADVAACCTRGDTSGCISGLGESYAAIGALGGIDGFSTTRTKAYVVGSLIAVARSLAAEAPDELMASGPMLLKECAGSASD